MTQELHFVVPGPLDQLTGGYIYDAHMIEGLRRLRWQVRLHDLPGRFPDGDDIAREALSRALASIPDGARVVIDGLAMGGLPDPIEAHGARLRIVSLVHHPLADETGISADAERRLRASERRALGPCRGVIVSSPFTAAALSAYGVAASRVRAVPPGTVRAEPAQPVAEEPPVLLSVASITPRKGYDVLVRALAEVRDLSWTCVCAGSPDRDRAYTARVRAIVDEYGFADRIQLVGEREGAALDALYQGASIFVLASWHEGYGMALSDALARGLPLVSTTGGAIPHTVPADAGILVAPGDAKAFGGALRSLLGPGGEKARKSLADAARRHAATLPTWEQSVRAFASALEELAP